MKKAKIERRNISDADQWLLEFENVEFTEDISNLSILNLNSSPLLHKLFNFLSNEVPPLLKEIEVGGVIKYVVKEDEFIGTIGNHLEKFICGKSCPGGFDELKSFGKPSKFCGKIFNVGDPTYTCKDCSADPTCVFCHDCFHNSSHKFHKYKLHTSCGSGGYCDCGDLEAWSTDPACDSHKDGLEVDESWDPLSALPNDIQQRATFMLSFLLQYCVDLICWNEYNQLPEPLKLENNGEKSHIVMLFNDESHTYDEVINTLKTAVKCTHKQAVHFATIVDKEGRSAIYTDEISECEKVVAICQTCTSRNGKKPLKCEAIHKDIIAHQLVALRIMEMVNTAVEKSDGLRRLLSIVVSQKLHGRQCSILEQIILLDADLWKVVRSHTHELFMKALLMDMYGRNEFAAIFAQCYKTIMRNFIDDDHEHSVSVSSLSVQIFTVPTIAEYLTLNNDILKICFQTFWNELAPSANATAGYLDFQTSSNHANLRRADYILNDLRYLLRHKPKWSDLLRPKFLEAFDVFLKILQGMQGMDSMVRKTQTHIAYEPEWEKGFNLQLWIMPIFELVLSWCLSDLEVYKICMKKCVTALRIFQKFELTNSGEVVVVSHDVSKDFVSMHAALSRFIAGLIPGVTKFSLNLSETLELQFYSENLVHNQLHLMEYSLRVLVLMAQVNARLWRRNGYSVMHQLFHYQNVRFSSEMFDRDILIMQTMAAIMDPNTLINVLLDKYDLRDWASDTYTLLEAKVTETCAEELFLLLLYILSERYVIGVSKITSRDIIRREVIHRLSLGSKSRSTLVKTLPSKDPDDDENCSFEALLDGVLDDVAVYREPSVSGKGVFELKKEEIYKCNQFFMHYSKSERSKMLEERKKIMKKESQDKVDYMPLPPPFLPQFEGVLSMLCCSKMEHLIKLVLDRSIKNAIFIDELTEEVLLIIAVGVLEVKRSRTDPSSLKDFNFLDVVTRPGPADKSIMLLLDELSQQTKEYSLMVKWVRKLLQTEVEHTGLIQMEVDGNGDAADMQEKEKARKALLAKERKEAMMEQMKNMQKAFMKTHSSMFTEQDDNNDLMDVNDCVVIKDEVLNPVAIGVNRSNAAPANLSIQCMLCHLEEESIDSENTFVVTCFMHNAKYLEASCVKSRTELLPEINDVTKVNISSCGHVIHSNCWEKYYKLINEREGFLLLQQRRRSCIDTKKDEYLCPLCNSLCNTVLPLTQRNAQASWDDKQDMSLTEFLAYLERFSAETMVNVKPAGHHSNRVPSSIATTFRRLYNNAFGSIPSPPENFMELFAKTLTEASKSSIDKPFPLAWMACSFSLQTLECSCRSTEKNIFQNLSDRQGTFWYALIQYLASSNNQRGNSMDEFTSVIFNFFCGDESDLEISILDIDVFSSMISLRFMVTAIQKMLQRPNFINLSLFLVDDGVFKLCILAYIVKVYITAPIFEDTTDGSDISCSSESNNSVVIEAWKYIKTLIGVNTESIRVDGHKLKEHVTSSLLPFLRCCAVFFHFLTGIKLPDTLKNEHITDELNILQDYLNLPKVLDEIISKNYFISEPHIDCMVRRWCTHEDVKMKSNFSRELCYVQPRRLITLPYDYSSLINMASGFRCPTVGDCSRTPALCLLCGTILCSQCYCCGSEVKSGACAIHSMECANGVGIFLRVRESEVMLLFNQQKGLFMPSPYLDQYGEPDKGFRRGNPLFLDKKRYDQLELLWLQQKIPETIAQNMEMNRALLVFDWQQQ